MKLTAIQTRAVNHAWMRVSYRSRKAFMATTTRVEESQRLLLRDIVSRNQDTAFGADNGFASISSYEDFSASVAPTTYADLTSYIERIRSGDATVLTSDTVDFLQPTSGSTGGRKLIPTTRTLRSLMQRTINAWIGDLYTRRPAVRAGPAYWSISPAISTPRLASDAVPIGFADDADYLGPIERRLATYVQAVSPDVADITDIDRFRTATVAQLAATEDLALISVWSPTFLTALVDHLETSTGDVASLMAETDPDRARQVASLLRSDMNQPEVLAALWPKLALLSCWADASASPYASHLATLFPHVELQPKGLLSTEAFVSFPLVDVDGAALAIGSHFFEFIADGSETTLPNTTSPTSASSGDPRWYLANELEVGRRYRPLVTTGGGLYRYQTNDVVEVVGHLNQCPLIRFVGRSSTSDLVGEKLAELFVGETLQKLWNDLEVFPTSAILLPVPAPSQRYHLVVELDDPRPNDAQDIAAALDRMLGANPHVAYARQLGQLKAPMVTLLNRRERSGPDLNAVVAQAYVSAGARLGDVKPPSLCLDPNVANALTTKYQT